MRIISNSHVSSCELYLVELLCIMKAVSRCCVCYKVRKNDSITPSPCSCILAAHPEPCQGAGALSSDGKMVFFLGVSPSPRLCASHPCTGWKATTTHAAYMCFTTWLLFIKPTRGTGKCHVIQNTPGRIMSMSHTLRKYSERLEWLLVFIALFHYSRLLSERQHVHSRCVVGVITWRKQK